MVLFGITTEPSKEVLLFFEGVKARSKDSNFLKNPFSWNIEYAKEIYIINVIPLYPNYTLFGYPILATVLIIWGFSWFILPPIILISLGVFWSKYFYYFMLRLGLKKAGYKGVINLISNKEIIKRLVFNGSK